MTIVALTLESRFAIVWVHVSVYGRYRLAMHVGFVRKCAVKKYVYLLQKFSQRFQRFAQYERE